MRTSIVRRPAFGTLEDGSDLLVDDADITVNRIRVRDAGATLLLNRSGTDTWSDVFGGTGSYSDVNAEFHVETFFGRVDLSLADDLANVGGGFIRFNVASADRSILAGIDDGDEFLFAITRDIQIQTGEGTAVDAEVSLSDADGQRIVTERSGIADPIEATQSFPMLTASPVRLTEKDRERPLRSMPSFRTLTGQTTVQQREGQGTAAEVHASLSDATGQRATVNREGIGDPVESEVSLSDATGQRETTDRTGQGTAAEIEATLSDATGRRSVSEDTGQGTAVESHVTLSDATGQRSVTNRTGQGTEIEAHASLSDADGRRVVSEDTGQGTAVEVHATLTDADGRRTVHTETGQGTAAEVHVSLPDATGRRVISQDSGQGTAVEIHVTLPDATGPRPLLRGAVRERPPKFTSRFPMLRDGKSMPPFGSVTESPLRPMQPSLMPQDNESMRLSVQGKGSPLRFTFLCPTRQGSEPLERNREKEQQLRLTSSLSDAEGHVVVNRTGQGTALESHVELSDATGAAVSGGNWWPVGWWPDGWWPARWWPEGAAVEIRRGQGTALEADATLSDADGTRIPAAVRAGEGDPLEAHATLSDATGTRIAIVNREGDGTALSIHATLPDATGRREVGQETGQGSAIEIHATLADAVALVGRLGEADPIEAHASLSDAEGTAVPAVNRTGQGTTIEAHASLSEAEGDAFLIVNRSGQGTAVEVHATLYEANARRVAFTPGVGVVATVPTFTRYAVQVDWDADGDFGDEQEDITSDVLRMSWKRGRNRASQIVGKSVAGRADLYLKSDAGRYYPLQTASPLTGNVLPARSVRILMHVPVNSLGVASGGMDGYPFGHRPESMTVYLKFTQPSTFSSGTVICQIADTSGDDPSWKSECHRPDDSN